MEEALGKERKKPGQLISLWLGRSIEVQKRLCELADDSQWIGEGAKPVILFRDNENTNDLANASPTGKRGSYE